MPRIGAGLQHHMVLEKFREPNLFDDHLLGNKSLGIRTKHEVEVAKFCTCVLLGSDHRGLGLGSTKEWRRPEVGLSTKITS